MVPIITIKISGVHRNVKKRTLVKWITFKMIGKIIIIMSYEPVYYILQLNVLFSFTLDNSVVLQNYKRM